MNHNSVVSGTQHILRTSIPMQERIQKLVLHFHSIKDKKLNFLQHFPLFFLHSYSSLNMIAIMIQARAAAQVKSPKRYAVIVSCSPPPCFDCNFAHHQVCSAETLSKSPEIYQVKLAFFVVVPDFPPFSDSLPCTPCSRKLEEVTCTHDQSCWISRSILTSSFEYGISHFCFSSSYLSFDSQQVSLISGLRA